MASFLSFNRYREPGKGKDYESSEIRQQLTNSVPFAHVKDVTHSFNKYLSRTYYRPYLECTTAEVSKLVPTGQIQPARQSLPTPVLDARAVEGKG